MNIQDVLSNQELLIKTNDKIIGYGEVLSVKDREIKIKGKNFNIENIYGVSITCQFKHEENQGHFNAKIKECSETTEKELTLFLIGELIIDFKRNYLRINDLLEIFYEKVPFEKIDNYYPLVFKNDPQEVQFDHLLSKHDVYFKIFQHLVNKIDMLTDKIDKLQSLLNPEISSKFNSYEVNLSASGIRFNIPLEEVIEQGDLLFLILKLPTTPMSQVKIIGEVLRINNNNESKELVIEYRLIDHKLKEILVQYIFHKDHQHIRSRLK